VQDDEPLEDGIRDRQAMNRAVEILRDREFDLIKWRQAERTGVCTSFISQLLFIVQWEMVMLAALPPNAVPEIMTAVVCYGLFSLLFTVPIGFTGGIIAYYLFRRSTLSISKMTVAVTLLIEFSIIGWFIAMESLAG